MKAKSKLKLMKCLSFIGLPIFMFIVTVIFTLAGTSELWGNMFEVGISNFWQWLVLIVYRVVLYLVPALLLALVRFDKRYKYSSRVVIWLNWTLFVYLLSNAIIQVFAINLLIKNLEVFNVLDGVVLLFGYIFTLAKKKKIEFDSTGTILGENNESNDKE